MLLLNAQMMSTWNRLEHPRPNKNNNSKTRWICFLHLLLCAKSLANCHCVHRICRVRTVDILEKGMIALCIQSKQPEMKSVHTAAVSHMKWSESNILMPFSCFACLNALQRWPWRWCIQYRRDCRCRRHRCQHQNSYCIPYNKCATQMWSGSVFQETYTKCYTLKGKRTRDVHRTKIKFKRRRRRSTRSFSLLGTIHTGKLYIVIIWIKWKQFNFSYAHKPTHTWTQAMRDALVMFKMTKSDTWIEGREEQQKNAKKL